MSVIHAGQRKIPENLRIYMIFVKYTKIDEADISINNRNGKEN